MAPSDLPDQPEPSRQPEYRPTRDYDGSDGSMRNLAIAAFGIAVVVVGGVWLMSHRHQGGVPVIEADATPVRIKPTDPGGMQVAGAADDSVLLNKDGTEADELSPPPEAPAPQALERQTEAAAPPAAPVPPPLPPPGQPLPSAEVPLTTPFTAPSRPAHEAPPARDAAPRAARQGATQVQLAALGSEAAAQAAWGSLDHRMPELLADRHPTILKVDHDGKTLFRLRTGGFADLAEATEFCAKVRAKGAACAIASF